MPGGSKALSAATASWTASSGTPVCSETSEGLTVRNPRSSRLPTRFCMASSALGERSASSAWRIRCSWSEVSVATESKKCWRRSASSGE